MKYSPKSAPMLLTLMNNLKGNLSSLSVYEAEDDELESMLKNLKRYLKLFEKVTSEESLLYVIGVLLA
jgi:hypothetical protein